MPVSPTVQPVPSRIVSDYSVTNGRQMPDTTTVAREPSVAVNPPAHIVHVGIDTGLITFTANALSAGQSASYVGSIVFSGMPASVAPASTDRFLFLVSGNAYTGVSGLVIASLQLTPQALAKGGGTLSGPTLHPGQTYTAFSVKVALTYTAVTATASGTVTVTANGLLYDIPA